MRPYQLWEQGPWVDLDYIQEVIPPEFVDRMGQGGFFIEMSIRFAFQNDVRLFRWNQDWEVPNIIIRRDGTVDEGFKDPKECVPLTNGVPSVLVQAELKIFRPLMYRWAGIRITGPVAPRGWTPPRKALKGTTT